MYVKYGSFQHADNLTGFSMTRDVTHNPRSGTPLIEKRRVTVNGEVLASTQANLRTAINAIIAAYQTTGVAWEFYHDDNTLSSHSLPLSGLLSPIRVVQPPHFPTDSGDAGEYATRRSYTITLEADYLLTTFPEIVAFQETVSIVGTGGPRRVVTELISGVPVADYTTNYTAVRATQSGTAVGFVNEPTPPAPFWPSLEHVDQREITKVSGERYSISTVLNFPISWKYTFTGLSSMFATPNS